MMGDSNTDGPETREECEEGKGPVLKRVTITPKNVKGEKPVERGQED